MSAPSERSAMLATALLIVAVILFALAAAGPFIGIAHGSLLPLGLAFFAGSFLVGKL